MLLPTGKPNDATDISLASRTSGQYETEFPVAAHSLVAAHPDVIDMAKSITVPKPSSAEQTGASKPQSTKKSTTAAPSVPQAKAVCLCKFMFLPEDSGEQCQEHLDNCDEYQKSPQNKKTALLGNLGLASTVPKRAEARSESITCRNCKRDFLNAHSTWFYNVHLKTCKPNAPNLQDIPEFIPSTPKAPVTKPLQKSATVVASNESVLQPSPRTPVAENNWQKPAAAASSTEKSGSFAERAMVNENNWQKVAPAKDGKTDKKTPAKIGGLIGASKWADPSFVPKLQAPDEKTPRL